jgi:hypothetical protein
MRKKPLPARSGFFPGIPMMVTAGHHQTSRRRKTHDENP